VAKFGDSGLRGLIVVDKPAGISSALAVTKMRYALSEQRVGHTGTLDPLATGVLPLCLGVATKLAGYLIADDKRYRAELMLGVTTDTLDRLGTVVSRTDDAAVRAVSDAQLHSALQYFSREYAQTPPMYSAIKVDGQRLYERARQGEIMDRAPRDVVIHEIALIERDGARVLIDVRCSKGTYIRSLVDDIGRHLGIGAHLTELRRTASGRYTIEDALPQNEWTREQIAARLITLESMTGFPDVTVRAWQIPRVLCGEAMFPVELGIPDPLTDGRRFQLCAEDGGRLLAVVFVSALRVRYDRVFKE
jgi:tRNA pseudouridine55 synthase